MQIIIERLYGILIKFIEQKIDHKKDIGIDYANIIEAFASHY